MSFLTSINPANGQEIARYSIPDTDAITESIVNTHNTWLDWRHTDFSLRAKLLLKAADTLEHNKESFGRTMSLEMGKPYSQSQAEVEKCAWVCRYYAETGESHLKDEEIPTEMTRSFVTYNPLGVILAVMPWNFPFWQVFRFAAPAIMAGNAGLLKHASNVQGCANEIESVFLEAGFPDHLFTNLSIPSKDVGIVIEHPLVKAVTLTGSTPAGTAVAKKAGSVLKKTVLELGGNDPYIILEDADIDNSVEACTVGRLLNTGQSCIAAKRFIVVETVYDEFLKKLVQRFQQISYGDQFSDAFLGPMVNVSARDELHRHVVESINAGAVCVCGGKVPDSEGAYYPATILKDVQPGMPAFDDELFGPVAAIIPARDVEEAITLANTSVFGLGGAVFTENIDHGTRLAAESVDSGSVFVNDFVKSDPRLPFGGIKESGYGRELSRAGIREFVNMKTIVVK